MSRLGDGAGAIRRRAVLCISADGVARLHGPLSALPGWPSAAAWFGALPGAVRERLTVGPIAADAPGEVVESAAPDGRRHHYRLTPLAPDPTPEGEPPADRLILIEPDVDASAFDAARAAQVLAEREASLRAVLDVHDDLVWSVDTHYRLTACNRSYEDAFARSMGCPPALGADMLAYANGPILAGVWQDFYDRALGGERFRAELDETVLDRDAPLVMGLSMCPIVHGGQVVGVACFLCDLSELRTQSKAVQRQNALLDALARVQSKVIGEGQSAEVYRALLDTVLELTESPHGFLGETRWAADGTPSLAVTALSEGTAWDAESRSRWQQAYEGRMMLYNLDSLFGQVLVTGQPVVANEPARDARAAGTPEGHLKLESFLGLPCHVGDRLMGMVGIANRPGGYDPSMVGFLQPLLRALGGIIEARHTEARRQAAELALQRAKEVAEAADLAKGDFLASMSHEIRTPLNAVLGLCELALDVAVDADQKSLLRAARNNSETLLNLISDILDFSRIDAGRIELDHAPFDLRRLVEDVAEVMALRGDPKGVTVVAAVQPRLPAPLVGDPHRVRQVLTNLVSNAVKYTEEGEVQIEVEARDVGDRRWVRIDVTDTGCGIPPEEHERIFERFHRVAATANVGGGGTGLGLAITRFLARHMGGEVSLTSQVGRGSRFRVELPFDVTPETTDDNPPPWCLDDVRVVVVHPVSGNGPLIARLLGAFGARVELVADAMGAVGLNEADVILTLGPLPEVAAPVIRLVSVAALGRGPAEGRRLTLPIRRDALIDAVRDAVGIGRDLELSPSMAPAPPVSSCTVLLVEDHVDNRAVARRHLENHGHIVDTAEHGGIAISKAREMAYDVILMDLHMPEVDGFEAVAAIRAEEQRMGAQPVPIIAVTAHATAEVRKRCFAAGFDGFVPKPVTGQSLREAVDRFASSEPVALIIDDAPDSRRLLVRHLRRGLGLRLRVAEDGASARAAVAHGPPSLALVDATLPDESGFDLVRWLRATLGPAAVLIMVTGRIGPEARRLASEAGCDGFVPKPVDRRQLLSEIESLRRPSWGSRPTLELSDAPGRRILSPPTVDDGLTQPAPPQWMPSGTDEPPPSDGPPDATDPDAPAWPAAERAYVDPDLLDLIPPFLDDRRADLVTIAAALDRDDLVTIARLGHSMKGSGRAYGMARASALGDAIQRAARADDRAALAAACAELAHFIETVEVFPDA